MKRFHSLILCAAVLVLGSCAGSQAVKPLERGKASADMDAAFASYLQAVADSAEDLHSIMILQHGKVLEEKFFVPDTAHILNSLSKTFTATAVGFAVSEGLLNVDDRIVDIFPESTPDNASALLRKVTVKNLLTMNSGHGTDPTGAGRRSQDWVRGFMEHPIEYEPGTCYCYNSLGTYVLSAAVQKVTGQKIVDYLDTRLWQPLGIEKPRWQESPQGVNTGGWGLYLKTEDLARMGLCLLNGGKFNGKQVIPADWVAEMKKNHVPSVNAGQNLQQAIERGMDPTENDWMQGYGYQMWQCRHGAVRGDGANGQYMILFPDKDAVIVTTAHIPDMAQELNLIWDYLLPVL